MLFGVLLIIIIVVSVGMIEYMMVRVVGRYRARILLLLIQAVRTDDSRLLGSRRRTLFAHRLSTAQVERHVEVSRESFG